MGKTTQSQLVELIKSTMTSVVSEAMAEMKAELKAELQAEAEGELLNYVEVEEQPAKTSKKSKGNKAKEADPKGQPPKVVIKGHPSRETWTQAMHDASRKAYNEASGSWNWRNYKGLLAAKKVA